MIGCLKRPEKLMNLHEKPTKITFFRHSTFSITKDRKVLIGKEKFLLIGLLSGLLMSRMEDFNTTIMIPDKNKSLGMYCSITPKWH